MTAGDAAAGPVAALVVESSAPARLVIAGALAEAGRLRNLSIHVTEAADGFEALWRFPRERFDLVVTALSLPVLTGLDLIRLLRARPVEGGLTVLAIPADPADAEVAVNAGATLCLPMPLDADLLGEALAGIRLSDGEAG